MTEKFLLTSKKMDLYNKAVEFSTVFFIRFLLFSLSD